MSKISATTLTPSGRNTCTSERAAEDSWRRVHRSRAVNPVAERLQLSAADRGGSLALAPFRTYPRAFPPRWGKRALQITTLSALFEQRSDLGQAHDGRGILNGLSFSLCRWQPALLGLTRPQDGESFGCVELILSQHTSDVHGRIGYRSLRVISGARAQQRLPSMREYIS